MIICGLKVLYHSIKSKEFASHIKSSDKLKRRIENKNDVEPLKFTMINIPEFFGPGNIKNGLAVRNVTTHDMSILDKNELRPDMIQISFSNLAIVWDLNENKEVAYVENKSQFNTSDSYVNCGIVPHTHKKTKNMKHARFLSSNEHNSLII